MAMHITRDAINVGKLLCAGLFGVTLAAGAIATTKLQDVYAPRAIAEYKAVLPQPPARALEKARRQPTLQDLEKITIDPTSKSFYEVVSRHAHQATAKQGFPHLAEKFISLMYGVAKKETHFRPYVVSDMCAVSTFQIRPMDEIKEIFPDGNCTTKERKQELFERLPHLFDQDYNAKYAVDMLTKDARRWMHKLGVNEPTPEIEKIITAGYNGGPTRFDGIWERIAQNHPNDYRRTLAAIKEMPRQTREYVPKVRKYSEQFQPLVGRMEATGQHK